MTTPQNNEELQQLLDGVYGDETQRTERLIDRYQQLYDLPCLSGKWDTDLPFFTHGQKAVNFVIVALYNATKQFLIVYSPTRFHGDSVIGWRLLGGPIQDNKRENIEEAVNRIVKREVGVDIIELEPVATLVQQFRFDRQAIRHKGIAFLARTDAETLAVRAHADINVTSTPPAEMAFLNREVFVIAIDRLGAKYFEPPRQELDAARVPTVVRFFHDWVFRPLMHRAASRRLKSALLSLIPSCDSFLDASAGDDTFVLDVAHARSPSICVANDIAWTQMAKLRHMARERRLNVLFTNHNVADLPFAATFDVVLLKNTLHHSRTKEETLAILRGLASKARRLIIVDIEEPRKNRTSYWINQYYVKMLGDAGAYFFTMDRFRRLVQLVFEGSASGVHFSAVQTVKGRYMIAVVDFANDRAVSSNSSELGT